MILLATSQCDYLGLLISILTSPTLKAIFGML